MTKLQKENVEAPARQVDIYLCKHDFNIPK